MNHPEIAAIESADWPEITRNLRKLGLRNRRGGPLTPSTVRKTFWSVRQRQKQKKGSRNPGSTMTVLTEPAPQYTFMRARPKA
jgi:hypothetical protein